MGSRAWGNQLRVSASHEEFPQVSGSYRREIETMHTEVMAYLSRHSSETLATAR